MKQDRASNYPTPADSGLRVPANLLRDRFCSGFHHAVVGGHLIRPEQLRLSFREGYRAGKLYLKEIRRRQGVVAFPVLGKIRFRSYPH